MTPDTFHYIQWRIQVWEFRLDTRLKSKNADTAAVALMHQTEANMLRSLLDTPASAMTVIQQIWFRWIDRAAALYRDHYQEPEYRVMTEASRQVRDDELAQIKERAA